MERTEAALCDGRLMKRSRHHGPPGWRPARRGAPEADSGDASEAGLEKGEASEESEGEEDDDEDEDAVMMRALGLPVAFASARPGRRRRRTRGRARPPAEPPPEDAWRQGWDPTYGVYYYYNVALGVTQWEPPEGAPFVALDGRWPRDAAPALARGAHPASERAVHVRFDVVVDGDGGGDGEETARVHLRFGGGAEGTAEEAEEEETEGEMEAARAGDPSAEFRRAAGCPDDAKKYWYQRYRLFSRFDRGVRLDAEGWYSATPEVLARHHARRLAAPVVIDAFAGVGANAIALAWTCGHVVAVDLDPARLALARHNAEVYGVAGKIDFVCADFLAIAAAGGRGGAAPAADAVFLSPPWGGPEYLAAEPYDLGAMSPAPAAELVAAARRLAPTVALYLPRTADPSALPELALPGERAEAERNLLNGKLKAVTAYFGPGVASSSSSSTPSANA